MRIAHPGYLGKCEICQADISLGAGKKREHYKIQHPEFKFSTNIKAGKYRYGCDLCNKVRALPNYAAMVEHYQRWHPEILKGPVLLQPRQPRKKTTMPLQKTDSPVAQVDKFFDGLTTLMMEVEQLRREKAEWMAVAEKWANKIVELQELLGRKP